MSRYFRIPESRRSALLSLSELSDACVKELFGALAKVAPGLYGPQLPSQVATDVASAKPEVIESIVDTLLSLYPAMISSNEPVDEFVDSVVDAMSKPGKAHVDASKASDLRTNLRKLLAVPSISLGAKATSVLFENERSLVNARILTDIRPVFELEGVDVGGALVIHTLKLEYFSDSDGAKEFFVSLDSDDIDALILKLERAKQKADRLKNVLSAASIRLLESEEKK
jgi:hypothetical protein